MAEDLSPNMKLQIHSETLIKAISQRPCLWNRNLSEHKDRVCRDNAWTEIYREIEPNLDNYSKTLKKAIGMQIIKKWYNIRDAYVKSRTNYKLNKCNKPYIYSKQMQFLDPHISGRDRIGASAMIEERLESDEETENWLNETVYLEEDEPSPKKPKLEVEVDGTESNPILDSDNVVIMLTKMIQKEEDEDRAFFRSIEPSVKSLSQDSKLEFRIRVLKLIKDLKFMDRTGIQVNLKMTVDDEQ